MAGIFEFLSGRPSDEELRKRKKIAEVEREELDLQVQKASAEVYREALKKLRQDVINNPSYDLMGHDFVPVLTANGRFVMRITEPVGGPKRPSSQGTPIPGVPRVEIIDESKDGHDLELRRL